MTVGKYGKLAEGRLAGDDLSYTDRCAKVFQEITPCYSISAYNPQGELL